MSIPQHVTQQLPLATAMTRFAESCPPASSQPQERLSWLMHSLQSGEAFLRANSAYQFIDLAVQLILGRIQEVLPKKMSRARFNHLKRQVREIVATQTNLNPQWTYGTDFYDQTAQQVTKLLNQRIKTWWTGRAFPTQRIKEALQYAATSSGYISPGWEQGLFGSDEEDVGLKVFGPKDVIPDGIDNSWDIQKANAVHIRHTLPTVRAKQLWPLQAQYIYSDRFPGGNEGKAVGGLNWFSKTFKGAIFNAWYGKSQRSTVQSDQDDLGSAFPEVDIFWTYLADDSFNQTGAWLDSDAISDTDEEHRPAGTSYFYPIPSYSADGPYTRKECQLYPTRRLIIWTRSKILYDGPSFWWHGRVPLVKFSMDQWVFEYLGSCVIEENRETQSSLTTLLRYFIDTLMIRLDPPITFNEREFSKEDMKKFKLRSPGERIPHSGMTPGDSLRAALPYQHYEPSQQTLPMMSYLEEKMNNMLGTNDYSALAKLQQVPSAEGIDKIMQSMSAIMTDYALSTERSLTELGYQFMWLIFQFDTAKRRFQQNGLGGLVSSDLDWDPGVMIPDFIPGESEFVNSSRFHRALAWGRKFRFAITPLSSFQITDSQQKLMLFQLYREPNFPMDPWTIAERWGLPNFGPAPADTIYDRWKAFQSDKAPFLAQLQAEAMQIAAVGQAKAQIAAQATIQQAQQAAQQQAAASDPRVAQAQLLMHAAQQSGDPQLLQVAQLLMQQAMQAGGQAVGIPPGAEQQEPPQVTGPQQGVEAIPATNNEGRPPSGNALPQLQQKSDLAGNGPRSTIVESR